MNVADVTYFKFKLKTNMLIKMFGPYKNMIFNGFVCFFRKTFGKRYRNVCTCLMFIFHLYLYRVFVVASVEILKQSIYGS